MKLLKAENIVWIVLIVAFGWMSYYSFQQEERRTQRMDRCFTKAEGDTTALDICTQISSAANGAVASARSSTFPTQVLLLGVLFLFVLKLRRLEAEIKELKGK